MTLLSWLYMGAVWVAILLLNIFCFNRIFSRKNQKGTSQSEEDKA